MQKHKTPNQANTLKRVYETELSKSQKQNLIAGLAQRWQLTPNNIRKRINEETLSHTSSDIQYLYVFHAISIHPLKGFYLDFDRLKELKEKGTPMPQLYGMSL